ncbi:MAG: 2-oxoacid:ferredoxin oxidoreductase subunit beta [Dehalococcoidia bacterium]|nr:2-oxoacid:ferredoxin oxidoreductase subunit beta [Dehalococcoidia bacterium]MDD5494983.1 2-oxoacid:ferredoxin oxidoreductase subunit beta [Dehalococcoidia bacterium]
MTVVNLQDYAGMQPAWCPGCGNFGILSALKKALVDLNIPPYNLLIVSGIGQAGKLPHYMKCNTFNSLHGRAIPVAIGAKMANQELTVIAVGGDGDGYAEGGNHWIHAMRRNHDITYMVHNNQIYALTKGQASPTSDTGFITGTTPEGSPPQINPLALAIAADAAFVARGFAGDVDHLAGLIKQAISHKGFALLDILQPCVSFNHINTYEWYSKRVYKLEEEKKYNPADKTMAFNKSIEWGDRIPIGIVYSKERPVFESTLKALRNIPLVKQPLEPGKIQKLLTDFS